MSAVYVLGDRQRASTESEASIFFNVSSALGGSLDCSMSMWGWFFCNLRLQRPVIRAKFNTKRRIAWNMARTERSSVILDNVCTLQFASIVCELTARSPSLVTWPRQTIRFVNESHFFRLRVFPASLINVKACRPWSVCSPEDLGKMKISKR